MSKTGIFIIGGLIASAAVYQILGRVPSDALNVALGVACGVIASIPVSLGLLIALNRQRQQNQLQGESYETEPEPVRYTPRTVEPAAEPRPFQLSHQQQQPQIIVIAPPQGQFPQVQFPQGFPMPAQWLNQQYPSMQENSETVDARDWRIIGEE